MTKLYPSKGLLLLWKHRLLIVPFLFSLLFSTQTYGQGYVNYSRVFTSANADAIVGLINDDAGNAFLQASFNSVPTTFQPTIPGIPNPTGNKQMLFKLSSSGGIVWSRYLTSPTGQPMAISKMAYDNGKLYCITSTTITNLATTDGSTFNGGSSDALFIVMDANTGAIQTLSYLGGSGADQSGMDIVAENGFAYIVYSTNSADVPVTTGPAFDLQFDHIISKLRPDGSVVYSTYTGRSTSLGAAAALVSLAVHNGVVAFATSITANNSFPITTGPAYDPANLNDWAVVKLNADGSTAYRRIIGGVNTEESNMNVRIYNGEIFLAGTTSSTNYPVTDGTSTSGSTRYHVVTKFNNAGSIVFSTVAAGLNTTDAVVSPIKFNSGSIWVHGSNMAMSPVVNVTDGSTGGSYLIRMNPANGQSVFATRYAGNRSLAATGLGFDVMDGRAVCMTSTLNITTNITTDGTTRASNFGNYLAVFSPEGKLTYGTYRLTGAGTNGQQTFLVASGNRIHTAGLNTTSTTVHMPVTEPILGTPSGTEVQVVSFVLCPPLPTQNDISPLSQTICGGGFTEALTGNKVSIPSSDMPMLTRGVNIPQPEINARYQWQTATAASGPWTNIAGAAGSLKDYSPPSLAETRYYRRLVLPAAGCGETPISTSAVAEVIVGANNSPVITSSAYTTCAGTAVNIEATVTGGAAPYTHAWDNGISSTTNTATVTPSANSVYTLTVTDNNGCQQKGQVVVNAYAANAGPDAVVCAGKPVRLGAAPPAGVAGVVYAWTPATGLSDATIAQPLATPVANQTYSLEMTIPVSGGGTCTTTDAVNVTVVAGPATANFAGNDVALCTTGTAALGTAAEAGFTYTWSPGNYLNATNASTATYNPGGAAATPNPITYTLTAASGGCSFTDDVTVYQLNVDAGDDRICGPRTIGAGDPLPNVTGKTFLWEVVSGPGTITGATNTATTTVSESLGSTTVYRLTMTYLGTSCTDVVSVPVCGDAGACSLDSIEVIADHGCPSTAFGAVTLRAAPSTLSENDWTYTWSASPAGGISSTTGAIITLTDNIERDVTVTVASKNNPNSRCSKTIHVNGAGWSLPVFTAQDHTICVATPVNIGAAAVAGYSYKWSSVATGDIYASNPSVSPAMTTNYVVVVKEDASGCTVRDTATVKVAAVVADPGSDWVTCSNAVVQLGSPARPGYTYSWTPAVASYQGGTDNSSAQPKVLVAISQDFTLRATDTESGCFKDSTVHIIVDNSPTITDLRDTAICRGASTPIGKAMNGNVTFAWSPATGLSSTTVAQPIANPTSTQVYTLVVTYYDEFNTPTCTKNGTVTVTVRGPEITMTDATVCTSGALYNLGTNASVSGAVTTYAWSPALGVTNGNTLNATVVANPTTSNQYTLIVRDADGCADTATTTLTASTTPPNAGSATSVCAGTSVTLGDAGNVGTCTWTVTPTPSAGSFPVTNGPNPVFTPTVADAAAAADITVGTNYTFTCSQDIGGCINTSTVTINVRAFSLPSIPVQTVCTNASTTIGVAPAANVSYSWSPTTNVSDPAAATTTVSNITSTSVYTLTAVHDNGCVLTTDAVIGVNPTPAPTVTVADVRTPLGTPAPAFSPQITPAAGTYTYSWTPANKVTDPYISNTIPTENKLGIYNYSLSITDGNGCTSIASALLRVENIDNTLPVTLSSFTATAKGCGVNLNWKVESASNFSHFIVERSVAGGAFIAVKKVWYEYNRINYSFQDAEPGSGKWSYRLKLVDIDGRFTYSNIVIADVKCAATSSLKIYPNPASSILYINSSKPVKTVTVYSLTGNLLLRKDYAQSATGVVQLPVGNLITGIYLVQVTAQDGTSQPARLVKD